MARNAVYLFWADLPAGWIAASALPHLAFVAAQAAWRACRGRARPFLLGKLDAAWEIPRLPGRRRLRTDLARGAVATPRFPIRLGLLDDLRNHLNRPGEASARPSQRDAPPRAEAPGGA